MATKKQKREAAEAKRAAFEEEVRQSGLRAQVEDRRIREEKAVRLKEEAQAINERHRKILAAKIGIMSDDDLMTVVGQIVMEDILRDIKDGTFPLVRYEDGQFGGKRTVVGEAALELTGDGVMMFGTVEAEPASLIGMIGTKQGPFSPQPPFSIKHPTEGYVRNPCEDYECDPYKELAPHEHGRACTIKCRCNRYGRVD